MLSERSYSRPHFPEGLLERLREQPVPDVSDALGREGALAQPFVSFIWSGPKRRLVGPALTVATEPGDNAAVWRAMELVEPGDVVVIKAVRGDAWATIGSNMARRFADAGAAGILLAGSCRDIEELGSLDLPVLSQGLSPLRCSKSGAGQISYPVAVGELVVEPGNLVCADEEGVLVMTRELVQTFLGHE